MAEKNLGKVAVTTGGVYSSTTTYDKLTIVSYNGSSYISKSAVPTGTPPTNTTYWQMVAEKGATGAQGPAGPAGATGPAGAQGNSGFTGAADELEVVNNLTQGGATAALSAEMGKELNENIGKRLDEALEGVTGGEYTPDYETVAGSFIDIGGYTLKSSASYSRTKAIGIPAGSTINISVFGSGFTPLAETDSQGSTLKGALVSVPASENATTLRTYSFTAPRDMYVMVSWRSVTGPATIVVSTRSTSGILPRLQELEESVSELENSISRIEGGMSEEMDFFSNNFVKQGTIASNGSDGESSIRCCTGYCYVKPFSKISYDNNSLEWSLRYYDTQAVLQDYDDAWSSGDINLGDVEYPMVRIVFRNNDDSAISPSDVINSSLKITYIATPQSVEYDANIVSGTLASDGMPANATNRCRMNFIMTEHTQLTVKEGVEFSMRFYDEYGNILSADQDWRPAGTVVGTRYRAAFRKSDNSSIAPSDILPYISITSVLKAEDTEADSVMNADNMVLKASLDRNWNDGTIGITSFYLWVSTDNILYYSRTIRGKKYRIAPWALPYAHNHYAMTILPNGDVLAVYRTEYTSSGSDDNSRKNPYIFAASNGYAVKEVDFGNKLKPSAWLQNCGICYDYYDDALFIAEYARPSIATANIWKVTGDASNADNWKVVLSKTLSGQLNSGFKHFHCVQYDPFSGHIYAASGDDDTAAAIYVSTDAGESFSLLHGPDEKTCRLLNFIFTKERIYWASDSGYANKHFLFSIERDASTGVMNFDTLTELYEFPQMGGGAGVATYGLAYIESLELLIALDRSDAPKGGTIPLRAWDIMQDRMVDVASLPVLDGFQGGFRAEYLQLYSKTSEIAIGFGISTLGDSGADNRNNFRILGNTTAHNIRNIVLSFSRIGDAVKVTYDTIYS